MPVVIEDLDVAVEPPAATVPSATASPSASEVTADHLDEVARHLAARRERVRAD